MAKPWQVKIVDHATGDVVAVPKFGPTTFQRRLDDTTIATTSWQWKEAPKVEKWRHELEIWGPYPDPVWAGPIVLPRYRTNQPITIQARDLTSRFDRLFVIRDRTYTQEDLGLIFGQIVRDSIAQDPDLNLRVISHECGVLGDRVYQAILFERLADKCRELARTAVDFTVVGRQLLIGGSEIPGAPSWKLSDGMCTEVDAPDDGISQVNDAVVVGSRPTITTTDEDGAVTMKSGDIPYGRFTDPDSLRLNGPLQIRYSEPDIRDNGSAGAAARNRINLFSGELPTITVTLKRGQYSWDQLVCGAKVDVALSPKLIPYGLEGAYELLQVNGTINGTGDVDAQVVLTQAGTVE